MIKYFVCIFFISLSLPFATSSVQAETFKLKCSVLRSNAGDKGVASEFLVDTSRKLVKHDCEDCPWQNTLYWGNDYIVLTNGKENMAYGENMFNQSTLTVIELENMTKYSVLIDKTTFIFIEVFKNNNNYTDGQFAPMFSVAQCTRGF